MYQVQVKNGKRIYTKAPVRRETPIERLHRHLDQLFLREAIAIKLGTINKDLTPGKAKFIKDVCR